MLQILKIVACVLGLTATYTGTLAQTGTHNGFELVRDEDNILVYERWVTFPNSNPRVTAREVKSEFFVPGDIHNAVALMQDESKIPVWQKHVSEFKVYPYTDSAWFEYSYHNIPWPVSDQDHFLEYTLEDPIERGGVFITFETVHDSKVAPVREGVSRMTLAGSWYFQQVAADKVKVTYRILSMPGNLPRFITDPVIRNNLIGTVRDYIKILEGGYTASR
jgi:hypothetical protein